MWVTAIQTHQDVVSAWTVVLELITAAGFGVGSVRYVYLSFQHLLSGIRTDYLSYQLLIPSELRSSTRQASPVRSMSSYTGGQFNRFPLTGTGGGENILQPQSTGTTTIARQFTGMSAMNTLAAQLTGSGLSPTRQLSSRSPSPTKMFSRGIGAGRVFPRPKSVIGARGKSIDEGRGMFLVRQMTGSGQGLGL